MNKKFRKLRYKGLLYTTIYTSAIAGAIAFYIWLGTLASIEILSWFHISLSLIGNIIIGIFAGETLIPIAIVGHILKVAGVF